MKKKIEAYSILFSMAVFMIKFNLPFNLRTVTCWNYMIIKSINNFIVRLKIEIDDILVIFIVLSLSPQKF